MNIRIAVAVVGTMAAGFAGTTSAASIGSQGLFFSAVDTTDNSSIVVNLNTTVSDFRTSAGYYSLNAVDAGLVAAWLDAKASANLANIRWNVMGTLDDGTGFNLPPTTDFGGLSTSKNIETASLNWGLEIPITVQNTAIFRGTVNTDLGSSNVRTDTGLGSLWFAGRDGGVGFSSLSGGDLGAIGESLAFYDFFTDQNPAFENTVGDFTKFDDQWTFSYVDAVGGPGEVTLTFGTAETPVPLPAAAWLLLSGIAGLAGVARRRSS